MTAAAFAPLFAAIESLLGVAVDRQARRLGPASLLDPWRGLHIDADDVKRILAESPHVALTGGDVVADLGRVARAAPRLARLADWFGLTDADLAIAALALAPDVDLRYERVYAYLQDDVARKRPSIDLIASLLCGDVDRRLDLLGRFDAAAPLMRFGILDLRMGADAPLLARPLGLDALWRNFLLGRDELDPRLAGVARLLPGGDQGIDRAGVEPRVREVLKAAVEAAAAGDEDLRLVLVGPHGTGKADLAAALAHDLGLRLLAVDLREVASPAEMREIVERARCSGALLGALVYLHGIAPLAPRDPQLLRALAEALAGSRGWFVMSLAAPLPQMHTRALRARRLQLSLPSEALRRELWRSALAAEAIEVRAGEIERLAARFRLSGAQIAQAAAEVRGPGREDTGPAVADRLSAAARALCGEELARLSQRISPEATFASLIATPEVEAQLREICGRVATREAVRRDWMRGCVHARSAGVTALFAGPSGTGKTLAAEVVAGELGLDLFRIDLSAVVSKYIGETEKNLDRVFAAAESANAVLFFDEADALFGKRSEVKDAHDRYANIEIAYLLQKMEQFDGLAILATNLKQNLDEAFARRLTFCVNFSFPEEPERRRLWEALWPPHAPRAEDVDFAWLAGEYALSGGNIRNMVVAAAHLAAGNGQLITREHVLHATRREYQKLGKHVAGPAMPKRGISA